MHKSRKRMARAKGRIGVGGKFMRKEAAVVVETLNTEENVAAAHAANIGVNEDITVQGSRGTVEKTMQAR